MIYFTNDLKKILKDLYYVNIMLTLISLILIMKIKSRVQLNNFNVSGSRDDTYKL